MLETLQYQRYQRQMLLKELGEEGQQKLLQSKVLVVGAGGLGCAALQYLAAAGVGTIGIVDDDVVSLTNLHRQVLYSTADIGLPKTERAAAVLQGLNPGIEIIAYNTRLNNINALSIIDKYDIVVDGTDNFSARYMINDACVLLNRPLVYGAISKFEGQVAVFNFKNSSGERPVNYRDLFPNPPQGGEVLNCEEAGVLGVLPGIIGSMQANETIKLITGMGQPLIDRLFTYNALINQVYDLFLTARHETFAAIPGNETEFKNYDYTWNCTVNNITEIDVKEFSHLVADNNITIIDVREKGEVPLVTEFAHKQVALSQLKQDIPKIDTDIIITFCQSGKRSMQAAGLLFDAFGSTKKIYSLKDGITAWKSHQQNQ